VSSGRELVVFHFSTLTNNKKKGEKEMFWRKLIALLQRILVNVTISLVIIVLVVLLTLYGKLKDTFIQLLISVGAAIGFSDIVKAEVFIYFGALILILIFAIFVMESASKNSVKNAELNGVEYKKGWNIFNVIVYLGFALTIFLGHFLGDWFNKIPVVVSLITTIGLSVNIFAIILGSAFAAVVVLDVLLIVLKKAKKQQISKNNNRKSNY
jgi:hypothetical protein